MKNDPKPYFRNGLQAAMLVLCIDQLSKYVLLELLHMRTQTFMELLPFFNLVMVWNTGVSFGMMAGQGDRALVLLILGTSVIVLMLLGWLKRSQDKIETQALALVIGGAAGNIVDRLHFKAVADFFDFHLGNYHWPAFNIADAAIFLGVVVLLMRSIFSRTKPSSTPE